VIKAALTTNLLTVWQDIAEKGKREEKSDLAFSHISKLLYSTNSNKNTRGKLTPFSIAFS
jgi:hypothetical protein